MKTLELEQMPLPENFPVKISLTKLTLLLLGQLAFSGFFLFLLIVGGYELMVSEPHFYSLVTLVLATSAIGLWVFTLLLVQSFKYLGSAGAPPLILTERSLQARDFSIPWVEVKALTMRFVSNGKGSVAYVHLDVENADSFPSSDMTGLKLPYFLKSHKKRLKLPPNAVLVPLELFELSSGDLMILLKRYWAKATGRPYKPQSIELLHPQKRFSDFVQKQ